MSRRSLSLACGRYDLLRPLIEGVVAPSGIDLTVLTMASNERHGRMLRHEEFDVCELSLAGYLVARDQGRALTAIPVFPHRRFRHGYAAKRTNAGVERPADLNGRQVGLDTLENSAGLWLRGILQDHYGLDLRTIEWWCQEAEDIPVEPAAWMKVRRVPEGRTIDEMLLEGELEATFYPEPLPSLKRRSPQVGLLFPNPREAEIEYYRKSGIFPIMHTVVIKNAVLKADPWVAVNLLQAFQQAKELCYQRMKDPRSLALAWAHEALAEQEAILGPDPWPYNLEDNRKALEAIVRYAAEEGLIKTRPKIEELFAPASLQVIQKYV